LFIFFVWFLRLLVLINKKKHYFLLSRPITKNNGLRIFYSEIRKNKNRHRLLFLCIFTSWMFCTVNDAIDHMTSLIAWHHWPHDVIDHMTSLIIWRHWSYDVIDHMRSLVTSRHWSHDVIDHITSLIILRHWSHDVISHMTSLITWRHWPHDVIDRYRDNNNNDSV